MGYWRLIATLYKPVRQVISLAGMPTVGKSSCITRLRKRLPDLIFLWDEQYAFLTKEDIDQLKILNERRKGLISLMKERLTRKTIYLEAEIRRQDFIIANTRTADIVVLDRGIEDTIFHFAKSGPLLDIQALANKRYNRLLQTRSSLVVLLEASLETLLLRLEKRQKETGVLEDRSGYYRSIYASYSNWFRSNVSNVITIQTDNLTTDQVADAAENIVTSYLGR